MTLHVFIPARRCATRNCAAVFVSFDPRCATCMDRIQVQRDIAAGKRASRRDVIEHKRLNLRRRLGLLASEPGA